MEGDKLYFNENKPGPRVQTATAGSVEGHGMKSEQGLHGQVPGRIKSSQDLFEADVLQLMMKYQCGLG